MAAFDPKEFAVPRERARVLVAGAGGLGSPALAALASSGVGVIGVADSDVVDLSNLHRQVIHVTAGVGLPKTASAEEFLKRSGFGGAVLTFQTRLDTGNIMEVVSEFDVVVDACDTFRSKFMLNDACVLAGRPFVHAGVLQFEGQIMTIYPERTACLRCLFESPPPPGSVPTCQEAGVLGAAAGVLGAIQAAEALKVLDGKKTTLSDRVVAFDARHMSFRTVPVSRDPGCPVCGTKPRIDSMEDANYPPEACD
ncbi:MAG: HesA/MoeB/ThiF family protein [Deltaproteobacteria bacterium]|nr:HesA/MoeB/ThiF family protein [Deltaproteobacteria bacterium]